VTAKPNYRKTAREALAVKADCYVCDSKWSGTTSRFEAMAHNQQTGHPVFIEGKPKEE